MSAPAARNRPGHAILTLFNALQCSLVHVTLPSSPASKTASNWVSFIGGRKNVGPSPDSSQQLLLRPHRILKRLSAVDSFSCARLCATKAGRSVSSERDNSRGPYTQYISPTLALAGSSRPPSSSLASNRQLLRLPPRYAESSSPSTRTTGLRTRQGRPRDQSFVSMPFTIVPSSTRHLASA